MDPATGYSYDETREPHRATCGTGGATRTLSYDLNELTSDELNTRRRR